MKTKVVMIHKTNNETFDKTILMNNSYSNAVTRILEKLYSKGFCDELTLEGKQFRFPGSRKLFSMEELTIVEYHALPDHQNPGDKIIVCAVTDETGNKGILITK